MRDITRVTFDFQNNQIMVEKGTYAKEGLTSREKTTLARLEEELMESGYTDFASVDDMDNEERKALMEKKKKYELLKEKKETPQLVWEPQSTPSSLLVIHRPDEVITYVEELPAWMIDRLTADPVININAGGQASEPDYEYKEQQEEESVLPGRTRAESYAIKLLVKAGIDWDEKLTVEKTDRFLVIMPKKFLGDDWAPINKALKAEYGDHWITDGRKSRWDIPL